MSNCTNFRRTRGFRCVADRSRYVKTGWVEESAANNQPISPVSYFTILRCVQHFTRDKLDRFFEIAINLDYYSHIFREKSADSLVYWRKHGIFPDSSSLAPVYGPLGRSNWRVTWLRQIAQGNRLANRRPKASALARAALGRGAKMPVRQRGRQMRSSFSRMITRK